MIRLVQLLGVALVSLCTGCTTAPPLPSATGPARTVLFVCGVFGDGPWYDGLREALAADGTSVRTIAWGMPKALFVANFSGHGIHETAEADLAATIDATAGPVDLVGHSAGCGVILGALAKAHHTVDHAILIAPSVSPGYDTGPALAHAGVVHAFVSERDTTFLKWRCGTFGTYDNIKTPAAGYAGFTTTDPKLVQHPYNPGWAKLGNDGGHGGGTSRAFVATMVVPTMR